jgi:hypothetical protein
MTYDHITHELTRDVLSGNFIDRINVSICIDHAADCLVADALNEEVPLEVLAARETHLQDASDEWANEYLGKSVDALRNFWNV